jgi:hypothetical protein
MNSPAHAKLLLRQQVDVSRVVEEQAPGQTRVLAPRALAVVMRSSSSKEGVTLVCSSTTPH